MRCAFLTMDDTKGWSIDAGLCIPHLQSLGWSVDWVPWRTPDVRWDDYQMVYLAAPWDYPTEPEKFVRVADEITNSQAVLINDIELVLWNLEKTYLKDLHAWGTDIVPSLWFQSFRHEDLPGIFEEFDCQRIILKPVISANASNTFLLDSQPAVLAIDELYDSFTERPFIAQPFLENVCDEGEFSLFYIDGQLSHAIRKTPAAGDFRVQEEHGGSIVAVRPDPSLRSAGHRVMQLIKPEPVYARADFVRGSNGRFLLMELELIEPSMYLRMHDEAPARFAHALDNRVRA